MQEEVENRTLTLVVNGTKFTGRLFKAAICKYLAHCKEKKLQKQRRHHLLILPVSQEIREQEIIRITAQAQAALHRIRNITILPVRGS